MQEKVLRKSSEVLKKQYQNAIYMWYKIAGAAESRLTVTEHFHDS